MLVKWEMHSVEVPLIKSQILSVTSGYSLKEGMLWELMLQVKLDH